MPELFIVIGANGAGKTTWADANRQDLPSHFYNADSIASGLGSADEAQHQLAARGIVDRAIAQHLLRQESFGFESTYSGRSRPGIVRQAKRLGYHTYAVFLGTEHPEINIERVRQRVL